MERKFVTQAAAARSIIRIGRARTPIDLQYEQAPPPLESLSPTRYVVLALALALGSALIFPSHIAIVFGLALLFPAAIFWLRPRRKSTELVGPPAEDLASRDRDAGK